MANSKQIGNSYEREVAKKLSLWITKNERDDILWREIATTSPEGNQSGMAPSSAQTKGESIEILGSKSP